MEIDVIIESDEGESWTERVSFDDAITVGRHFQCSLCLDSDLISRQHAVIRPTAHGVMVEDVSTNGTLAGGMLLRRTSAELPYGTPIVAAKSGVVAEANTGGWNYGYGN